MNKTTSKLMMLIVILALGLTACASQATTPTPENAAAPADSNEVVAEGHLKPVRASNLSFQARGIVEQVNVKIGDRVRKGDVLARLSNAAQAEAGLAAARLELLTAQQALDALIRNGDASRAAAWDAYQRAQIARAAAQKKWNDLDPRDIQKRLDDQQATVNERKQDLQDAQTEFDKYKDLDPDNAKRKTAEDNLRAAQRDYDNAVAELEKIQREQDSLRAALDAALAAEAEAKYQWEISAEGVNKDQLAVAEARLEAAKAQAAAAEAALANYIITAPFDGVVLDVAVSVGEQVGPEVRAVSVADPSAWVIETSDITELEVVNVAVGQAVTFTPDALPDLRLKGVVAEISGASYLQSGDVIYTVYIHVQETDPRLKWGMTVEVTFEPLK
ncbi:MAG: efflux RND transporter periplasmic adaptor subunit [Chloroflexi bacterium]|nr:efflux RND transporter periplasmic adaptor subunit [Chloroflexota bacterium]MBI5704616.1 efflux RND transporter periplasmic adaptor subunit [Chloroflexota bacterium]